MRQVARLALAGCALIITGCVAGVTDPVPLGPKRPSVPGAVAEAVRYAHDVQEGYERAVRNQSLLVTWTGMGLIPLGTIATGMAVFSANPTAIGIVGLSGAGTYATSAYLRSQPAQIAYLAGHEAVNCAIEAVAPVVAADTSATSPFAQMLQAVDLRIADVRRSLDAVQGSDLSDAAKNAVMAAETAIASAQGSRRRAYALRAALASLPTLIVTTVDRIQGEVKLAVVRGQTDISALGSIVGGLGSVYRQLNRTPVAPDREGAGKEGAVPTRALRDQALDDAVQLLRRRTSELREADDVLRATVDASAMGPSAEALKRCAVDPAAFAPPLTIVPPGPLRFAGGKVEKQSFRVDGGQWPYTAVVIDGAPEVSVSGGFGPVYVVAVSTAASGKYAIEVQDVTRRGQLLNIEVGSIGGNSDSGSPSDGDRGRPERVKPLAACTGDLRRDDVGQCLDEPTIKAVQRAICLGQHADGKWGDKSVNRLIEYEARVEGFMNKDRKLRVDLRKKLTSLSEGQIVENCKKLSPFIAIEEADALRSRLQDVPFEIQGVLYQAERPRFDPVSGRMSISVCQEGSTPSNSQPLSRLLGEIVAAAGPLPTNMTLDSLALTNAEGATLTGDPPTVPPCAT